MASVSKTALSLVGIGIMFVCVIVGTQPACAGADISVYLSAPRAQGTLYSNTTVETFSGFATGIYTTPLVATIGTYQLTATSKLAVQADDQYGSGTGNYVALGAQTGSAVPVTLQLKAAQAYFGLSYNAGDRYNEMTFYSGSKLVGYYSTAKIVSLLSNPTVTTVDGRTYQSSSYYGQPSTSANSAEPYAFVNFIFQNGTYDKVVFGNSNTTATGFESDNHTIRTTAPVPDGSFVSAGIASVPEPGNAGLMAGIGLCGSIMMIKRRRKRVRPAPAVG